MLRETDDNVHSVEQGDILGGEMYVCDNDEIRRVNSSQVFTHER